MRKSLSLSLVLGFTLVCLSLLGADAPKQKDKPIDAIALADRLQTRITIELEVPNTTLGEILAILNEKYQLPVQVSHQLQGGAGALSKENDRKWVHLQGDNPVLQERVSMPKLKNAKLETLLHMVCEQLNATYLIESDHILLVEKSSIAWRVYGNEEMPNVTLPLVTMKIEARPLAQALNDLSDRTNVTILISRLVDQERNTPIHAKLLNTPIDRAIELLAEMAELSVVRRGNAYLVTTSTRAKQLRPEPIDANGAALAANAPEITLAQAIQALRGTIASPGMEELTKRTAELTQKVAELEKRLAEKK